jgi:hypothetical protein
VKRQFERDKIAIEKYSSGKRSTLENHMTFALVQIAQRTLGILSFTGSGQHSTAPPLPSTLSILRIDFIVLFPRHTSAIACGVRPKASQIASDDPVMMPGRSMQGMASKRQSGLTVFAEHLIEHCYEHGSFCE